jgi:excisionase family DNA binding protein
MVSPAVTPTEAASPATAPHDARATNASREHDCMTAREVASWLRVERKTVYEYANKRMIPCQRLGRRIVFHRGALTAWLAGSSTENPIPAVRPTR